MRAPPIRLERLIENNCFLINIRLIGLKKMKYAKTGNKIKNKNNLKKYVSNFFHKFLERP